MTALSARIAEAFKAACLDELAAPKPGNVHVLANGHRLTTSEFARSAEVAAGPLTTAGAPVGARIAGAIEATFAAVRTNTNLGIVLLCAPIAAAAEAEPADLCAEVTRVLDRLDREDADLAFRAIVLASPGGLGQVKEHDVFAPATTTLKAAMATASDRDRVAHQYACGFGDIFDLGEPLLRSALPTAGDPKWATLSVYLGFLSAFPDSHIVRRHGMAVAEETRQIALSFQSRIGPNAIAELLPQLMAWDASLKQRGINPGTSADLTVATLFVHRLRSILPSANNGD